MQYRVSLAFNICASFLLSPFLLRQRYSAPQSPINVIIFRPFDRSRTASISARSVSERRKRNTFRLSSGCSETPRRVPFFELFSGTTRNVIVDSKRRGEELGLFVYMINKWNFLSVPTRTAPTNGWSRTHLTAMLAMLTPPWRSPILRSTVRSRWKRAQSPHTLVITSRYYEGFRHPNQERAQKL